MGNNWKINLTNSNLKNILCFLLSHLPRKIWNAETWNCLSLHDQRHQLSNLWGRPEEDTCASLLIKGIGVFFGRHLPMTTDNKLPFDCFTNLSETLISSYNDHSHNYYQQISTIQALSCLKNNRNSRLVLLGCKTQIVDLLKKESQRFLIHVLWKRGTTEKYSLSDRQFVELNP